MALHLSSITFDITVEIGYVKVWRDDGIKITFKLNFRFYSEIAFAGTIKKKGTSK